MLKKGINSNFVELIQDMYSKTKACVQLESGISDSFDSVVGLKQGCNLSPTLFNIFVNDLIHCIDIANPDAPFLKDIKVSCLLYADDLVLLSESKEGLQEALNALDKYSKDWFLEVNLKKTKCLMFSRRRASLPIEPFKLGGKSLEFCSEYCYLGVVFTDNGSFKSATKALNDKAKGAMFSLLRDINNHHACRVDVLFDLFDRMVKPIALYNAEVWGANCLPANFKNNDLLNFKFINRLSSENLHIKFIKMALGVGKLSSNWGVLSESGRYPLILNIFNYMIKFYYHLITSKSELILSALGVNIGLAKQGFNCWFRALERILTFFKIQHILYTSDTYEVAFQIYLLKKTQRKKYDEQWQTERTELLTRNSKIELFLKLKKDLKIAKYLHMTDLLPSHRIAISKIRLSSTKFPIELGRYEKLTRDERVCTFGCGKLGDEIHYLFNCNQPFIKTLWEKLKLPNMDKLKSVESYTNLLIELFESNELENLQKLGAHSARVLALYRDLIE